MIKPNRGRNRKTDSDERLREEGELRVLLRALHFVTLVALGPERLFISVPKLMANEIKSGRTHVASVERDQNNKEWENLEKEWTDLGMSDIPLFAVVIAVKAWLIATNPECFKERMPSASRIELGTQDDDLGEIVRWPTLNDRIWSDCENGFMLFSQHPSILLDHMISLAKLRRLYSFKRKSGPRKWTSDLVAETSELYVNSHQRIKDAKKVYTRNKGSSAWEEFVAIDDQKRHGNKSKLPKSIISNLPFKSPTELADEWVAAELNRKQGLVVSPGRIHQVLKMSRRSRAK